MYRKQDFFNVNILRNFQMQANLCHLKSYHLSAAKLS